MLKAQFMTDQGKVREKNEDAGGIFYNSAQQLLAIVADGMGGHQAGEIASDYAVTMAKTEWEKATEVTSEEEAEAWLSELINKMNTYIYEQSLAHEEQTGMGTTVVVGLCTEKF